MKFPKKIATVVMLLIVIISYAQDYNFAYNTIPENLKKNANAVIRFEDITVSIKSQTSMFIKVAKAVTVINKLGDSHKVVVVNFDKNQKIKNLDTYIYDANGEEIKKVKNKDYRDISSFDGFSLYSDNRMMYYEYIPVDYPYTIYTEYEIETVNTGFIPTWLPVDSYVTSIEKSSYKVDSNNDLELRIKETNFDNYNILKEAGKYSLSYLLQNQPATKYESLSPSLDLYTPKVMVGLYKFSLEGVKGEDSNWKEFGKWRYDFLKNGNDKIDDITKAKVQKLVEEVESDIEKAKIIYKYVQNKTRYISVQEGIGGWKPISANTVDRLGYGDCKGLTNYTKTLLDAVGVPSHYSVIWAGREMKSVDKDFFSMQGNHVILNLPNNGENIWLECTSQDVAFGELGDFTDNRDVLVITPEGGVVKRTKKYKPSESVQDTKGKFKINKKGAIEASLKISSIGIQYDNHLTSYHGKNPKDIEVQLKRYFSNINNITFSKINMVNNKEEAIFEEDLEFVASDYGTFSGNQMFVNVNAFSKNTYSPKRVKNRKLPFEIKRGYTDVDVVEVQLPTNWNIEYLPKKVELKSKFGTYAADLISKENGTLLYSRKLQIVDGKFPKEEYEAYREFRKKIRKYDNSKIILNKK